MRSPAQLECRKDLGTALICPPGDTVAASCGGWKIVYTVGKSGIAKGGKISFGIPHGFTIPQVDNPYMPGYCTAECSDGSVSLVLRCARDEGNAFDFRRGRFGSISTGVLVHICEGALRPGAQILFHYGNTRGAGPGSFVRTLEGPAVFTILVCPTDQWVETSRFYYLENPPVLRVVARAPKKLYAVMPSIVSPGEDIPVHITAKDEFDNTSLNDSLSIQLGGEGVLAGVRAETKLAGRVGSVRVRAGDAGCGRLRLVQPPNGGLALETNPVLAEDASNPVRLYWGDLHCHSFLSEGLNEPEYLYEYAQDVDHADFAAVTDHGYMTDEAWAKCVEAAATYNRDGTFVTFLGYEHSAGSKDRNVYFRGDVGRLVRSQASMNVLRSRLMGFANGSAHEPNGPVAHTTPELFEQLKGQDAIVIPHLHMMDWENHDPQLEPLVEIYSNWGNREYSGCKYASIAPTRTTDTVQYALSLGYRLGFVGGGDGHGGRPGKDYWLRVRGAQAGGITAVYAKELTRQALWDALWARHCYATTGKRIVVKFRLNGYTMGDVVPVLDPEHARQFEIEVHGTDKLKQIVVVKNNRDVRVVSPGREDAALAWEDESRAGSGDSYYLRIEQADGAMAWSSPIWMGLCS